MSSTIRPPTGSPGAASGLGEASDVASARDIGETGKAREAASSQAASETRQGAALSPTGTWLARLDAQEITRAQAIDGLVAQALEAQGGAQLSPAQRTELESILRSALLDDPVLGRLLGAP